MQALILAGGEGTRLRPLTIEVPKPVVPLANRPFISYMIDWLERHGFDDIVMSCGFLAEGVREVLGYGRSLAASRSATWRSRSRSAPPVPVKLAEPMLDERFAVLNGDILTDFDLSSVMRFHEEHGARATLALTPVEDPSDLWGGPHRRRRARRGVHREAGTGDGADEPRSTPGSTCSSARSSSTIDGGRAVSFEREVFPALVGAGLYGLEARAATGSTSARRPLPAGHARHPRGTVVDARSSPSSAVDGATRRRC